MKTESDNVRWYEYTVAIAFVVAGLVNGWAGYSGSVGLGWAVLGMMGACALGGAYSRGRR